MTTPDPDIAETRILVPAGALGSGVSASEVEAGLAASPHAIALDAGSTDSGPAYLATGKSKYSRQAVKRDLMILMTARAKASVPLLIGSCGTSGCDDAVNWTLDIVREIAREQDLHFKLAVIHSEVPREIVRRHLRDGRARALAPSAPLTEADIDAATHIVGMMGGRADPGGAQIGRADRGRRAQQRHLDLLRAALDGGLSAGSGMAHGENPRMRRRRSRSAHHPRLDDGGAARG